MNPPDALFRTLADPSRRAIFERLCQHGEQTVAALTAQAGISQPAVSKHLAILKRAGLVHDRHEGRQTHYSPRPGALAPLLDWTSQMAGFWESRFDALETLLKKDGSMNQTPPETRSITVEREFPHPPEKLWRALTQPHLMEEWLMKNDFKPAVGHRFNLRGEWGGVLDCEVLTLEPNRSLSYRWDFAHEDPAFNLESVVTFTLVPTANGTRLRVEQAGFRPEQKQAYGGAKAGWQQMLEKLEQLMTRPE